MTDAAAADPNNTQDPNDAAATNGQDGNNTGADNNNAGDNTATNAPTNTGDNAANGDTTGDKPKADWPDDWREKMAGGDAKELERLKRFASPAAVYTSNRELEKKLSSTPLKKVLPENPTEEDLAAYRKDYGIPEKPEDYDIKLSEGLVIGDDDKPVVDEYLKIAHANHMKPDQVKSVLDWYYKDMQAQQQARQQLDEKIAGETREQLQSEWGNEYDRNVNLMKGYFGDGEWDRLMNARLADGTPFGSDKALMQLFADRARDYNPVATSVGSGSEPMQGIITRKAELQAMQGDRGSKYWNGPEADKLQAEYRQLIEAEQKFKKK